VRFRRSIFTPSRMSPLAAAIPAHRRKRRLSRRNLFFGAAALVVAGGALGDRMRIRGNGIVAGELTAVSPIVQARLQNVFVTCLDRVTRGQRLAEFDNEATVQAAAQQLNQLELQLLQARAQAEIAATEAQAARKLEEAQLMLSDELRIVFRAVDELLKKRVAATLVWEKAKADVARSDADASAVHFVYETKQADRKKADVDAEVLQQRIDIFKNSPELTGHFFLTAAKDGIITECAARPGEVIAAKTPIFQIFNPDNVYAVVFFDPSDGASLALGQQYKVRVGGVDEPLTGRITGFYPELSALPSSLTRYFWQQEKWSQYAPARIDFDGLTAGEKDKLRAWAQLSASRWQLDELRAWAQLSESRWQLASNWVARSWPWRWLRDQREDEKNPSTSVVSK
jgi:multidrug resistance efflux pump